MQFQFFVLFPLKISVSLLALTVTLQFDKSSSCGSYAVGEPACLTGGVALMDTGKSSSLATVPPCCSR